MSSKKESNKEQSDSYARLLTDTPVSEFEGEGYLGFKSYRDALVDTIIQSKPRFTIGIFGQWGTGKTSLMKLIKNDLDKNYDKSICVWFNPWRYQNEENIVTPFLQTLGSSLRGERSDDGLKKVGETIKKLGVSLIASSKLKLASVEVSGDKLIEELENRYDETTKELPSSTIEKMKLQLEKVREDNPETRIVIFIDDLDRCKPEEALNILEAIKVFFDLEGFVFILGLDKKIIKDQINSKYGERLDGNEYLKKIVQVQFTLPPLQQKEIENYLANTIKPKLEKCPFLDDLLEYSEFIYQGADRNPREVKRFINSFILSVRIARDELEDLELAIVFHVMKFRWNSLYRYIAEYGPSYEKKELIEDIETYVRETEIDEGELKDELSSSQIFTRLKKELGSVAVDTPQQKFFSKADILFEKAREDEFDLDPYFHFNSTSQVTKAMPQEPEIDKLLSKISNKIVDQLNYKKAHILKLYYGFEDYKHRTYEEIGHVFEIEPKKAEEFHRKALIKLVDENYKEWFSITRQCRNTLEVKPLSTGKPKVLNRFTNDLETYMALSFASRIHDKEVEN